MSSIFLSMPSRPPQNKKTMSAKSPCQRRTVRVTIGRHGPFTPEAARKKARELLAQMASGQNPNHAKREARAKGITLAEAYEDYLEARKGLRPSTRRDYDRVINTYLADWKRTPLVEITKDMVSQRHRQPRPHPRRRGHRARSGGVKFALRQLSL